MTPGLLYASFPSVLSCSVTWVSKMFKLSEQSCRGIDGMVQLTHILHYWFLAKDCQKGVQHRKGVCYTLVCAACDVLLGFFFFFFN